MNTDKASEQAAERDWDRDWERDWLIDPDPLAEASTEHMPTGYRLKLVTHWNSFRDTEGRLFVGLGLPGHREVDIAAGRRWLADRGIKTHFDWRALMEEQALRLWRRLGFDVDHTRTPTEPLLCTVARWRDAWTVQAAGSGQATLEMAHSSGLSVTCRYTHLADRGCMGWQATPSQDWTQRQQQEVAMLRLERGYFDSSPDQLPLPFASDWRTHWKAVDGTGEQWLEHVSGVRLMPFDQQIQEEGVPSWILYQDPTRSAVGDVIKRQAGLEFWEDLISSPCCERANELGYQVPRYDGVDSVNCELFEQTIRSGALPRSDKHHSFLERQRQEWLCGAVGR